MSVGPGPVLESPHELKKEINNTDSEAPFSEIFKGFKVNPSVLSFNANISFKTTIAKQ